MGGGGFAAATSFLSNAAAAAPANRRVRVVSGLCSPVKARTVTQHCGATTPCAQLYGSRTAKPPASNQLMILIRASTFAYHPLGFGARSPTTVAGQRCDSRTWQNYFNCLYLCLSPAIHLPAALRLGKHTDPGEIRTTHCGHILAPSPRHDPYLPVAVASPCVVCRTCVLLCMYVCAGGNVVWVIMCTCA